MKAIILNKWIQLVNENNIEELLKLYDKRAILLPTLSNKIRKNKIEIRNYFEHFLAKKDLKAEIKQLYIQSMYNGDLKVDSGTYVFKYLDYDDILQELPARFTFIIKNGLILEHHSSTNPKQ